MSREFIPVGETITDGTDDDLLAVKDGKITYKTSEKTYSYKNPEEEVRAAFYLELVKKYKYPPERIDLEIIVPRRTPADKADIVVYEDEEKKSAYLVIECKKDAISQAEFKQAIEQAFGNANSLRAKYAAVVAGNTRTFFDIAGFKPSERERNVVSDLPVKYGKVPKYGYIKGDVEKDLKVISRDELIRTLEKAHDTVWQGGRLAPTTAFDEIAKLLFCKLQDEKEETKKGEAYKFQIGTHEEAEEVFKRIDTIYQKAKKKDSEVFKEDIRLEPKIVYSVVEHLQSVNFSKTDLDTKGVAFERFMEDFFKGKMGQYFTPREIIDFCVEMIDPTTDQTVLDPACGSGGFLLHAMDYIRKQAEKEHDEKEAWTIWHNYAMRNLYGIEINDQIARVCKMNMIIHDDGHTNVISTDALQNFNDIKDIHKGFGENKFDLILTNPPFGATVKETEQPYLPKYDLAKDKKAQKTEILFIERCIEFLRPGGRMAIVLPDGILTNSSLQYVRDYIMEKTQILAVVSLPQYAFMHFGAGVKSSLVFLRKKKEGENTGDYPIFMAIAEHIGYDATGRPDTNEFDTIQEEYQKFLKNPKAYKGL
jgi:type I restriction enzyme M protein